MDSFGHFLLHVCCTPSPAPSLSAVVLYAEPLGCGTGAPTATFSDKGAALSRRDTTKGAEFDACRERHIQALLGHRAAATESTPLVRAVAALGEEVSVGLFGCEMAASRVARPLRANQGLDG